MSRILYLPIFVLLVASALVAQGGPPLLTDDPATPGNGDWEINLALTTERRSSERVFEAPIADINYGVGDRVQLKLEIPWVVRGTDDVPTKAGLGNSLLGLKWRFFQDEAHGLEISTYPQLELNNPTHSVERGLVERGARFLLPVEIAKKLGPIDINPELGYWLSQREKNEWFSGVAVGGHPQKRLELLGEIYSIGGSDRRDTTFGVGSRLELTQSLRLLMMAGRSFSGITSDQPTLIGYLGLQILITKHEQ